MADPCDLPPLRAADCTVVGCDLCRETATGEPKVVLAIDSDGKTFRVSLPLDDAYYLRDQLDEVLEGSD